MSTVNAATIYTGTLNANNLIVGNATSNVNLKLQNPVENLTPNSESFAGDFWFAANATRTANAVTAPDGTLTGVKLIEAAGTTLHKEIGFGNYDGALYVPFVWSIYAKANTRSNVVLHFYDVPNYNNGILGYFNLTDGFVYSSSGYGSMSLSTSGISQSTNGWYRCWVGGTYNVAGYDTEFYVTIANSSYGIDYTGDGTSGLFLWGSQLTIGTTIEDYVSTKAGTRIPRKFVWGSNVTANSWAVSVGNSITNSVLTSSELVTNSIIINGTTYTSIPNNVLSYTSYTTTGWSTWSKPAGASSNDLVTIMMWGGGGGPTNIDGVGAAAGGGGACVVVNLLASQCNATCNVFIGSGGVLQGNALSGTNGENTVFWTNSTFSITAYGGGGAFANTTAAAGGSGGGWFSNGDPSGVGGGPLGGARGTTASGVAGNSTFGGGGGAGPGSISANGNQSGGWSVYGGGGGANFQTGAGGSSIYGGGGGAYTGPAGTSVYGGNGGNSSVVATAPGGGGWAGGGARGEARIWVTKVG